VTRPRRADLKDIPVRDVLVPELLAELCQVQQTIRGADPRARATEITTHNQKLLSLFRQERRILRELRRRQALLRQGIDWTVLSANGGNGQPSTGQPREG
jgi:hypothetical protein